MSNFNPQSVESIVEYAKKLKGRSLRIACDKAIENHGYKGKGNFGQLIEKFYFGYEPNSNAEADFSEVGMELKTSSLKILKSGEYRSKERLVLNIINYLKVHEENFEDSSFWKKNAHLLLVFYLNDKKKDLLDYLIKLVDDWKYPDEDLLIIKNDWQIINHKIKEGQAHEISEGDTFYLGACTKGSTAEKSLREQPFSKTKAKQRAYSLKQGYVNHIIATISQGEKDTYGKILSPNTTLTLDQTVVSKFEHFYGKSAQEIEKYFSLKLNKNSKSYLASLTKAILGIELDKKIAEFEKADIQVKTVRLNSNNLPKESISFPSFEYKKIVKSTWDKSAFKYILEQKFFFVFYQFEGDTLILKKVKFWNMPYTDIKTARTAWSKTVRIIKKGEIVKEVTDKGVRKTNFPKKSENKVTHVRPHAKDSASCYDLPVREKLTNATEYTKHCFWLNAGYVKDKIYPD